MATSKIASIGDNSALDPVKVGQQARDYFLTGDKANASGFDSAVLMFLLIGTHMPIAIETEKGSDVFDVSCNVFNLFADPKGKIERVLSEGGKAQNIIAAVRSGFARHFLDMDFTNEKGNSRAMDGNFKTRLSDAALCAAYLEAYIRENDLNRPYQFGKEKRPAWVWGLETRKKFVAGKAVNRQALIIPQGAINPPAKGDSEEVKGSKLGAYANPVWLDGLKHMGQQRSAEALKKLARAHFGFAAPKAETSGASKTEAPKSMGEALSFLKNGLVSILDLDSDAASKFAALTEREMAMVADIQALTTRLLDAEHAAKKAEAKEKAGRAA